MQPGCKQPPTASNEQEITFSTFSFAVSKTFNIFAGNMEREPVFKYQKQIDELLALGCQLPELFVPDNMEAFKNVDISIGDSLSEGILSNEDGRKTITSSNGHFDFYEYEGCDLNKSFQITKNLIAKEYEKG